MRNFFFLQIYSKKFKFKCNNNSNSKKSETPQKRANVRKQPIACVLTLPAMRCGGWWWVKVGKSMVWVGGTVGQKASAGQD